MANKNYLVNTPLRRNTKGKSPEDPVAAGEVISMDEKIAEPLVACKALTEQQTAKAATKGK